MGCHRKFGGESYKYWASVDTYIKAKDKAASKRKTGFLVRIVPIHSRQFDLYIRKA